MSKNKGKENVSVLSTGEAVYTSPADGAPAGDGERKPEKPTETKREKFLRLARRRVPAAVKRIGQVAALGNKASYDYEEGHATKIIDALTESLNDLKRRFAGQKAPEATFKLD